MTEHDLLGMKGRRGIVVGGGFGMGRETAILLGKAGASVVVADLDESRARGVADEVTALGADAAALSGDITDGATAEQLVATGARLLGGLDFAVNIVGASRYVDLLSLTDDVWDQQFDLNLRHHLHVSRAAARLMIESGQGGAIAVVGSVSGIYAAPYHGAYGAAKAGLQALVRTMSQEWGPSGVRVNAVAPDLIATPRVLASFEERGADQAAVLADDGSLKRLGEPREVAGALLFLLSDLASFITGQTLIVDGGVNASMPHRMGTFSQSSGTTS